MARIGLVLGAGGIVGHAFHAGVLRALSEVTGWDPRDAEIIVGTSAGSHVAALLRAGLSAPDVAARYVGDRLSPQGTAMMSRVGPPEPVPRPRTRALGMASPALLVRAALRPWASRPGTLLAAALPTGRVSLEQFAARIRWLFGEAWPDRQLWVPAVRLDDGRRVAFGRTGAPRTDVGTAVAASCAVPGWFEPVEIDRVRYIDGGAHSPTNADLLAGIGLDLVIVSSPMSIARHIRRASLDLALRATWRWRLAEEARRLRAGGTHVLAFQPTATDLSVMGLNAMSTMRRNPVVAQAYQSTLRRLERPQARERLAPLFSAARKDGLVTDA